MTQNLPIPSNSGALRAGVRRPSDTSPQRKSRFWWVLAFLALVGLVMYLTWPRHPPQTVAAPAQVQVDHSFYINPPVPRQVRVRMHGHVVQQLRWDYDSVYNHLGFVPDITKRVKLAIMLGQQNGDGVWLSQGGRRHALTYAQAMEMANGKNRLLIEVDSRVGEKYKPDLLR